MDLLREEKYLVSKNPQNRREAVEYRGASFPYLRMLLLLDARACLNLLKLYLERGKGGGAEDVVGNLTTVFNVRGNDSRSNELY